MSPSNAGVTQGDPIGNDRMRRRCFWTYVRVRRLPGRSEAFRRHKALVEPWGAVHWLGRTGCAPCLYVSRVRLIVRMGEQCARVDCPGCVANDSVETERSAPAFEHRYPNLEIVNDRAVAYDRVSACPCRDSGVHVPGYVAPVECPVAVILNTNPDYIPDGLAVAD